MVKKIYLSLLLLVLNLASPATLFASSETQGNQVENSLKILQKPSADQIAFVKPKEEEKKEEQTITKSEKPQEKKSTKKENNPKDQEAKLVNKLSHLDYKTQNPPQKLYNREQTHNNQHLPPVYFKSYYLSLAFKAAEKNDIKGLNAVLSKYNFINGQNIDGDTMLMYAIQHNSLDVARLLLAKGAYVNATNQRQRTALHYAAILGELDFVKLLLSMGADYTLKDDSNMSALDYAHTTGQEKVEQMIQKYISNQ